MLHGSSCAIGVYFGGEALDEHSLDANLVAAGLITAALAGGAIGQQDETLGKVTFPTSCAANVQAEFDRGVAMLRSYWFLIARRKFDEILQQESACAMAYWGVAMDYLSNTLATTPTRADAQAAWDALEKVRAVGAKTQFERFPHPKCPCVPTQTIPIWIKLLI